MICNNPNNRPRNLNKPETDLSISLSTDFMKELAEPRVCASGNY